MPKPVISRLPQQAQAFLYGVFDLKEVRTGRDRAWWEEERVQKARKRKPKHTKRRRKTMPVAQKSVPPPLIPAGKHTLTLRSVEEIEQDSFNGDSKVIRWVWHFISNQLDDDGANYEYRHYTGPKYGNPKAGLTELLDMMMPDADEDDRATVNTDTLCKKKYSAQIVHGKKENGEPKAVLKFITPFIKNTKTGEDTEDVFAQE